MIFPPLHVTVDKGHGRIEKRKIQVASVKDGQTNFPYAAQFIKVFRSTTDLYGNNLKKDTAYLVTSLTPERADAKYLLSSIRGHWSIENSLHWVRDVTFDEDRSQIRTGSAPRVFATIRNLAISLLRLNGVKCIAAGLRKISWNSERALELIGV
jgi:hypothetical protein